MQISKAFHQLGEAGETMIYVGIDALTLPITYGTYIRNKYA